ncbi:MAG: threonine synthase, partial [Spirochaetia bacterium]|nr:threonine synthase [Spirochaetia bacterium]
MKFYSTRNKKNMVSFREAVFQGLSPDGGLYNPAGYPDLSDLFKSMNSSTSFIESSTALSSVILKDDLTPDRAESICRTAFPFKPELAPADKDMFILELYHGPSCAFKDFGASFLAASMEEFLKDDERKAIILTATSGDTGSAVAQAFHNRKNIEVVILYPSGRVSPLQEKQLTTLGGNVTALEVKGSFDDCQRMVKDAFMNKELSSLPLTSANSINLGRLFPQSFYYVWAVNQLKEKYSDIIFSVPSGNFGNLTAGVLASRWGLPVNRFIAATNINREVPEYLESGIYTPRPSVQTYSNAMDVGNPSNFERLKDLFENDFKKMGELIKGEWVDDDETIDVIRDFYEGKKRFIDPHTAVGYTAAKRYMEKHLELSAAASGRKSAIVTLSTAHPGKFLEVVEKAAGLKPPLPVQLEKLLKLKKESVVIEKTDSA